MEAPAKFAWCISFLQILVAQKGGAGEWSFRRTMSGLDLDIRSQIQTKIQSCLLNVALLCVRGEFWKVCKFDHKNREIKRGNHYCTVQLWSLMYSAIMITPYHLTSFLKDNYCTISYLINLQTLNKNDYFLNNCDEFEQNYNKSKTFTVILD